MAKKRKPNTPQDRAAKIASASTKGAGGPSRVIIGGVVVILAIVITVGWVIIADQSKKNQASAGGDAVPAAAAGMGKGFVAFSDATLKSNAPTLDVYEDFQCPVCGQFETIFGSTMENLASQGKVKLVYHFKTIIDANVGNDSSLRSAVGALCAADEGKFQQYHDAVYKNQPAQEGTGWTDQQLTSFAKDAGITGSALDSWTSCYDAQKYSQYVTSVEEQSAKDGINATPTVLLAGEKVDFQKVNTPDALTKAIEDATK